MRRKNMTKNVKRTVALGLATAMVLGCGVLLVTKLRMTKMSD